MIFFALTRTKFSILWILYNKNTFDRYLCDPHFRYLYGRVVGISQMRFKQNIGLLGILFNGIFDWSNNSQAQEPVHIGGIYTAVVVSYYHVFHPGLGVLVSGQHQDYDECFIGGGGSHGERNSCSYQSTCYCNVEVCRQGTCTGVGGCGGGAGSLAPPPYQGSYQGYQSLSSRKHQG